MTEAIFYKKIQDLGIDISLEIKEQFRTYKELIQKVNQYLNLTAVDDDQGIYSRHFYDSLSISPYISENSTLCDVGSGAGFPGLVLAIARPDLQITCLEPTGKRANFLKEVQEACNLKNVFIENQRAEDFASSHRESFDYITARAVAYLDILSELALPLCKKDGLFIAMKGEKAIHEWEESKKAVNILGGHLEETVHEKNDDGDHYNLLIRKVKPTHKKYPRAYAKIKKRPLSGRNNG